MEASFTRMHNSNYEVKFVIEYFNNERWFIKSVYIAEWGNSRIVQWKYNSQDGQVVAGGDKTNQLNWPTYVIIDKSNDSFIICDQGNRRVVEWTSNHLEDCLLQANWGSLFSLSTYFATKNKIIAKNESEKVAVQLSQARRMCLLLHQLEYLIKMNRNHMPWNQVFFSVT
jgi:hypothetical protein